MHQVSYIIVQTVSIIFLGSFPRSSRAPRSAYDSVWLLWRRGDIPQADKRRAVRECCAARDMGRDSSYIQSTFPIATILEKMSLLRVSNRNTVYKLDRWVLGMYRCTSGTLKPRSKRNRMSSHYSKSYLVVNDGGPSIVVLGGGGDASPTGPCMLAC